jgi:hypothetical protein
MLFIHHRKNTITEMLETDQSDGVEIDIRSWNSELILNHEAFEAGETFKNWISECKNPLVILNVKCEGLEEEILRTIKKADFKGDFFFLDQSFPFLIKTLRAGLTQTAVRLSEYESPDCLSELQNQWVWLDSHTSNWSFLAKAVKVSRETGKKICLASPELHNRDPKNEIVEIKKILMDCGIQLDAVCTKSPDLWL